MTAAAQVCDPDVFYDIDPQRKTNCENCTENLSSMVGSVWYVFSFCQHVFPSENCAELFSEMITEDGVCFTYNRLNVTRNSENPNSVEWTLEGGYNNLTGQVHGYPRTGTKFALIGTFQVPKILTDRVCKGSIQGFKVFLHLPNEIPQMSKHFYLIPFKRIVNMKVVPKMFTTAPDLRDLPIDKRQCFFSDERYLRFFKYYTQNNCEVECVANLTIRNCGCQRFYMPSEYIKSVRFISTSPCLRFSRDSRCETLWNQRYSLLSEDHSGEYRAEYTRKS
jgi:acid-sensing ion channel, other